MDNIITGEKIQSLANLCIGLPEDFSYNPNLFNFTRNLLSLLKINGEFDNPKIIFCYSHRLNLLIEKLIFFKNPFILISHNSDENINERYESLLYSDKIIKWFAQNINIKHPKLHFLPIGIANSMWNHGNLNTLYETINKKIEKSKDFYFYFSVSTNYNERINCLNEIEKKGIKFGKQLNFNIYLEELSQYKFAICPYGNGIDCHRLWECYYLGVIPIVLNSSFSEQLKEKLPCILLNNWSDFDKEIILLQYDNLIQKLQENREFLELNYFRNLINNSL